MNKLYLIKNQEEFQGKKYLTKSKHYFEGWYFKQVGKDGSIALIPGINLEGKKKKAFIQIITNNKSYFIDYKIEDFKVQYKPFQIQIGNNIFSKERILLQIKDATNNLNLKGKINYFQSENIHTNCYQPNIMGPFSYLPFLECNHAIISMKNITKGSITINDQILNFDSGIGYVEKDWGTSFPKKYIWCQGNQFQKSSASFMIAIATVPLKILKLKGLICVLKINSKEYRFTTYNFAKIKNYQVNSHKVNIKSVSKNSQKLLAPIKGKMQRDILESITSSMHVTLKKKNKIIFSDTCTMCGLEIVD